MKKIKLFCFGFGQVAQSFVKKISSEKISIELTATSREKTSEKIFENISFKSFNFSKDNFDKDLIKNFIAANYILISIAPSEGEDIVLKNFKNIFQKNKDNYKWICYLSATSVYGNHNGAWVDEKSITSPTSINGKERLNAEKNWLDLALSNNLPFQIFRLSGIYSNHNNVLSRLKSGEAKIIQKKEHYFSRIHIEDIANVLFKSLTNFKSGEIYNISDDQPSTSEEVMLYGAKLLKMKKPDSIELKDVSSEMVKNFYKDSKKVSNKKMKTFFQYDLKFPSYKEGLSYIKDNFI